MTREELLKSKEYWIGEIQLTLFEKIKEYLIGNNLSKKDFAKKLGVSKGYISQIMNGDFNHKISKLVELSLAIGKIPRIKYIDIEDVLKNDREGISEDLSEITLNINSSSDIKLSISDNNISIPINNNMHNSTISDNINSKDIYEDQLETI